MYAPTSNSDFDPFFDDDHNLYITNNILTPNLPTDALNPNPNSTEHNYTHLFNSPNNFLQHSPTPTYCNTLLSDDDFSLTYLLLQYQHQVDNQQENDDQQVQPPPPPPPPAAEVEENMMKRCNVDGVGGEKKAPPRRRRGVGKTDRHSKIHTAQGTRDRRMRLSLPIARRFFDLQDMLGFDKASKTIEWLFHKSKPAIKDALNINIPDELLMSSGSASSSESEVVSVGGSGEMKKDKKRSARIGKKEGNKGHGSNSPGGSCVINDPVTARESRDKARARARERTREKMMMANGQHNQLSNPSKDSSSPPSFSSIIMDYPSVHDNSHTYQNPRAPSSSISQELQQVQSAWDEYSNIWQQVWK